MNKCIICNTTKLNKVKVVNKDVILECTRCRLAVTKDKTNSDNKAIYKDSNLYVADDYNQESENQKNKFKYIYRVVSKFIPEGKILEVGAGFGLLASILSKDSRISMEVVEPNLPLIYLKSNKQVKQHKLTYQKFLKSSKYKYSGVLFIDVLEHFSNPDQVIKSTKNILNKHGVIVVNLPNYKSIMARQVKNWSWWMVEDHYYHFSPSSLSNIFIKNGFTIQYLTTYESFIDYKKNLDGNFSHLKNNYIRKALKLVYFSMFTPVYFLLRKLAWKMGYGGLILLVAKKK